MSGLDLQLDLEGAPRANDAELPSTHSLAAQVRRVELIARRSVDADLLGRYHSAFRGTGLVFSELREYQPGDEIRNIHWKATARTNRVYVKSFIEERQQRVLIGIDRSASTAALARHPSTGAVSASERARECGALLAILASLSQDPLGMFSFSEGIERYLTPSRRRSQARVVLAELLAARPLIKRTDIRKTLSEVLERERRRSLLFLLSDFYSRQPFEGELRAVALRHDLVLVNVESALTETLPEAGLVRFVDPESGASMLIDTSHQATREALRARARARRRELSELAVRVGADLMHLDSDPVVALSTLMAQRKRRFRS